MRFDGLLAKIRIRELGDRTWKGTLIVEPSIPHGRRPHTLAELEAALMAGQSLAERNNCWTTISASLREPSPLTAEVLSPMRCWEEAFDSVESTTQQPGFPGR